VPDGISPFRLGHQRMSARIEFLNYEQDLHYVFALRGLSHVRSDIFIEERPYSKSIGDLYLYELTAGIKTSFNSVFSLPLAHQSKFSSEG